jgi:DNA/RNA-binding domain of Phe-tRNA-synthetase-like protein
MHGNLCDLKAQTFRTGDDFYIERETSDELVIEEGLNSTRAKEFEAALRVVDSSHEQRSHDGAKEETQELAMENSGNHGRVDDT